MIWLFLLGGVYSMALIALGIVMGYRLSRLITSASIKKSSTYLPEKESLLSQEVQSQSGALKSMTPYERSLEDSKEITERIEHLIS